MNKQPGLLAGTLIFFVSSLATFVARFATSVIVARSLGVEGKGVYVLVITISTVLILCLDFGLNAAIRYLAASRQHTASTLFIYSIGASIVISLVGGAIFFWLYRNYLINNLLLGVPSIYILIILIVLPFNTFTSYVSAIVIGVQRLAQYNLINIARIYANLGFQCLSFYLGLGVAGAVGSWIASNLIAGGLAVWFIRDQVEFKKPASDTLIKDSFNYGSKNYFANLLNFANYRLDTFILNMYSGPSSVGIYSTAVSTAELVWYIPNSISDTLFIKSAASERGGLAKLTSQVCRQSLVITIPVTIVFALVGSLLIPLVYGQVFQPAVAPFLLLLPGIVCVTIIKILSANISGSGLPQYATYSSLVMLVVTIALDFALIPGYGVNGAAVASSIAYLVGSLLTVHFFSRISKLSWGAVVVPQKNDLVLIKEKILGLTHTALSKVGR